MKNRLFILIAVLVCAAFNASAQSPFRPLPKHPQVSVSPFKKIPSPLALRMKYGIAKQKAMFASNEVTAMRFSLPFAAYDYRTQQISTGLGYGWNKLHWIDSTQKYYTDLSIFAAILINGSTTPTPYNFTSIGVGVGFWNGLINIIPCYNISNTTDKFGVKISFGLTLK